MMHRLCFLFVLFWVTSSFASAGATFIQKAERALDIMDHPQVIAATESVLKSLGSTQEDRLRAFELQAYALIFLGDDVHAEESFHALLKIKPDFKLPKDSSLKLLQVFSKVSLEFAEAQKKLFEKHLEKMRAQIRVTDETTTEIVGGESLTFRFTLEDPKKYIDKIMLAYRKNVEEKYATLPVGLNLETGQWEVTLSREWTENEKGLEVEYFVSSRDKRGYAMRDLYSMEEPNFLYVRPGLLSANQPFYKRIWFWSTVGAFVGASTLTYMLLRSEAQKCTMPPCVMGE
ncbi:MAG: hypothetical protein QGI45_01150 [Myxococcota bacterium]|jgi:hypothetical protein|nr:hypothetical protein [Myxococcota bacterium]